MLYFVRVAVVDKPGSLAEIAASLGKSGANIVDLNVIDVEEGFAVDEMLIEASLDSESLRQMLEEIPSCVVELIKTADIYERGPASLLQLSLSLMESGGEHLELLVEGLTKALRSVWCAAVKPADEGVEVVAGSLRTPASIRRIETPWLPLDRPRRLREGYWMPTAWRIRGYELAAAPLDEMTVIIARGAGPRFRPRELRDLGLMLDLASRIQRPLTKEFAVEAVSQ